MKKRSQTPNMFSEDAYGNVTPRAGLTANTGPLARPSDPSTSQDAAVAITKDELGDLRRWAVECVRKSPGLTARELAALYCPDDPKRIDRRLGECARLGFLRVGEARQCSRGQRKAQTWYPVT